MNGAPLSGEITCLRMQAYPGRLRVPKAGGGGGERTLLGKCPSQGGRRRMSDIDVRETSYTVIYGAAEMPVWDCQRYDGQIDQQNANGGQEGRQEKGMR